MPAAALATTEVPAAVPPEAGVTATSPEALAAACRALIGDPAAARQAGMAARTHALRRSGPGRFLAEWDRLLAAAGAG